MAMVNLPVKIEKEKIMNSYYIYLPLIEYLKIVCDDERIIEINFISKNIEKTGQINAINNLPTEIKELKSQLIEYFQSNRKKFQIDFQLSGTDFQQAILTETAKIPYGQTVSYKELAERAGLHGAWQATGQALKKNKLPIIIPCHRVVGSSGLGGYNGGLKLKKTLLKLEGSY